MPAFKYQFTHAHHSVVATLLLVLTTLFTQAAAVASEPYRGDVISNKLEFGSSGFWGASPFVALPKGRWKILDVANLGGANASHRGYVLKNEILESSVPVIVVVYSTTPNFWNTSFSAIPKDAQGINLYSSFKSSTATNQSFYFPDFNRSNYQLAWLRQLGVTSLLNGTYASDNFALTVTRSISSTRDIRILSFIRKSADDSVSEPAVRKWNDEILRMAHDSFYEKLSDLGNVIAFDSNGGNQHAAVSASDVAANKVDRASATNAKLSQQTTPRDLQRDLAASGVAASRIDAGERIPLAGASPASAEMVTPIIDKPSIRPSTSTPSETKRYALIVGNDGYKNVPRLDNAVADAKAIGSLFKGLGYEVSLFTDLDEKKFKGALRQFKQRLAGGEEVIFFYAGHGVQLGSSNYLLPTDVGSDNEDQIKDEGIPLQRVLDDLTDSKVKFALAMIDACRDNPFKSRGRSIGGRGLAATSAATGQMIIFSSGTGQQALDRLGNSDDAKNGLFTRVLIDRVIKSSAPIHLLMRDVRAEVAKLARSVGHEQVPAIYDQVIGDFYFTLTK